MANFGDFNFGDDAPSPDTDPVPDNVFPEEESESDNKQNDVANYPEPGESDTFDSGDPTEFSVYGNPEEPGAQQDHSPPVINEPRRPNSVGAPKRKYVKQIRKKSQESKVKASPKPKKERTEKIKATAKPRKVKSEVPVEDQIEEDDPFIRKLKDAGYAEIDYADTNFEPFIERLKDAGYSEIDYSDTGFDPFIQKLRDAGFSSAAELNDLQTEMFGSPLNAGIEFGNLINKLYSAGFEDAAEVENDPTGFGAFVDKLNSVGYESSKELYSRLNEMFGGIPRDNGILEQLLFDTFGDDPISRNDNKTAAKSATGKRQVPVAIVELDENDDVVSTTFERIGTAGFDENSSLLNSMSVSENLEELDMLDIIQFVESIDLNDYLGDTTQDSSLIEFQAESYDWLL